MPNRILREGILTSPRMARLGWAEEVFYRRLHSVVDDFGRYFADVGLLRAACYPRQLNKVSDSDIGKWLQVIADAGLVRVYPASDGERYLEVVDFGQQVRAKKSRFPGMQSTCVADAKQPPADAHLDVFGDVDVDEEKKGARKRAPTFDPSDIELPEWLPREDWQRWCADRKDRRKPVTAEGAKSQLRKLEGYRAEGFSPSEVIEHSIAGGFQGLYAPARKSLQAVSGALTVPSRAADATVAALAADRMTPEQRAAAAEARRAAMAKLGVAA